MSEYYTPELGQAGFGQPWQELGCPEYIEALLQGIGSELERVKGNTEQQWDYPSPFGNTGERYDNGTFSAHAYDWNTEGEQTWNFRWRDFRISWYKYLGRGMSMNRPITPDEAVEMFNDCIASLRAIEDAHDRKEGRIVE